MIKLEAYTFVNSLKNSADIKRKMDAALREKQHDSCKDGFAWVINIPGTSEDQFPGHAWTELLGELLKIDVEEIRCSTHRCDTKLEGREKKGAHVLVLTDSAETKRISGQVCIVPVCGDCNSGKEEPYEVKIDRIATRAVLVELGESKGWKFNDITRPKKNKL